MPQIPHFGQLILDRYEVVDLFPEGGQARVAKGVDRRNGGLVAIRQLLTAPEADNYDQEQARFKRAAGLRIGHPNVVDPIDSGEENGESYTIYPFIDGVGLDICLVRQGGCLAVDDAVHIIRQAASALSAGHVKGVIHRDIKPGNILIDAHTRAFVIDYGICSLINEPTITQGDRFLGTASWAAPEQVLAPRCKDLRTDLYALGSVFYNLLTGAMPVGDGTDQQVKHSICKVTPTPPRQLNPLIPEPIDRACMRLLAKRPEDRFANADEFIRALDDAARNNGHTRFCRSCGRPLGPHVNFCTSCGAAVNLGSAPLVCCIACGAPLDAAGITPTCNHYFGAVDHRITYFAGTLSGVIHRVPEGIYDLGRDVLSPRDHHISRVHLRLACANGSILVNDAGSANGTLVNGVPAQRVTLLEPGAELAIAGNKGTYTRN